MDDGIDLINDTCAAILLIEIDRLRKLLLFGQFCIRNMRGNIQRKWPPQDLQSLSGRRARPYNRDATGGTMQLVFIECSPERKEMRAL